MQLYQNSIDEHLLWEYLQTEQWIKATELVDWYYDRSNSEGFDDPRGIRKADYLTSELDSKPPNKILRSQSTYRSMLYFIGVIYLFFGFLSYKSESINILIVPAIFLPIVLIAVYNLIFKTTEISITDQHVEFRKSTKKPIAWNNILAIYYYHRGTGGVKFGPGDQAADFILIWKKDAVKPESYYLNYMELEPEQIVYMVNQHWKEKTKI